MASQPTQPDPKPDLDDEAKAILADRLKTLDQDRKTARAADDVFERIAKIRSLD